MGKSGFLASLSDLHAAQFIMKIPGGSDLKNGFSSRLINWHLGQNTRKMPWKGERDPYKIWLSEVILQQTRVDQGLDYYNRFVENFPDIHLLASASEQRVFKLWEGLGYYNRCRNLLATAKFISNERKGIFPSSFREISSLKGVGPYTAAAISSFAYGLPYAVVDGNVYRVLSRIFGISLPIDTAEGKKHFSSLANELLDRQQSGHFNQAIMDFGAVVCKPVPECSSCIFNDRCVAFKSNLQEQLPVKSKRMTVRNRWFSYFLCMYRGSLAIRQRKEKDIWQQLFEFPQIEHSQAKAYRAVQLAEKIGFLKKDTYSVVNISTVYKQQLSHQLIYGQFITVRLRQKTGVEQNDWLWVKKELIRNYAFPGIINRYLQNSRLDLLESA